MSLLRLGPRRWSAVQLSHADCVEGRLLRIRRCLDRNSDKNDAYISRGVRCIFGHQKENNAFFTPRMISGHESNMLDRFLDPCTYPRFAIPKFSYHSAEDG